MVVGQCGTKIVKTDNLTPRRQLILMPNCPLLTLGAKLSGVHFCESRCFLMVLNKNCLVIKNVKYNVQSQLKFEILPQA